MSGAVERVRGTNDILPSEWVTQDAIKSRIEGVFRLHGYRQIDVPIIEHTDLFLRKSGEEVVARMYAFSFRNRRICLRPELTASVMRAYLSGLQGEPLPLRLSYAGPVFRYEKPQRARYRQFTQVGVELVGVSSPLADAEVIALACRGLDAVGLTSYRVVLGHLGAVGEFLGHLQLDDRIKSFLMAHLDRLSGPEGEAQILERLPVPSLLSRVLSREGAAGSNGRKVESEPELLGAADALSDAATGTSPDRRTGDEDALEVDEVADLEPPVDPGAAGVSPVVGTPTVEAAGPLLKDLVRSLGEEQARQLVEEVLDAIGVSVGGGSRSSADIVTRLVRKLRQEDQSDRVRRALEFIRRLEQVRGSPPAVFAEIRALLDEHELGPGPLRDLESICRYLGDAGIPMERITIDLGLGRGLQYYTGTLFEIHHGDEVDERRGDTQLCGGGRYDDLIRVLGGRAGAPACGFAYGLERVQLALAAAGRTDEPPPAADVLVVPATERTRSTAVALAEWLRQRGLSAELDVRERGVRQALRYATRRGLPFVAVVGDERGDAERITLRDLATRAERTVELAEIDEALRTERQLA